MPLLPRDRRMSNAESGGTRSHLCRLRQGRRYVSDPQVPTTIIIPPKPTKPAVPPRSPALWPFLPDSGGQDISSRTGTMRTSQSPLPPVGIAAARCNPTHASGFRPPVHPPPGLPQPYRQRSSTLSHQSSRNTEKAIRRARRRTTTTDPHALIPPPLPPRERQRVQPFSQRTHHIAKVKSKGEWECVKEG